PLCPARRGSSMLRDSPSACPSLWRSLPCPPAELRLDLVLSSGQTFRWWESSPGAWTGVLGERVWTLRQERDRLWYTVYGEEGPGPPAGASGPEGAETDRILRDYFQLEVGLPALYRAWGAADPLFRKVARDFPGEVAPRGVRGNGPRAPTQHLLTASRQQACGCCGRTPWSASSPSSAPPTTTSPASPP
uniref:8-oxoguanine DNA glycosylase N-terminal domain-containing protein n=1 Tax=Calidris pygmaea TaxID=425635 RepID=A0A8C3PJ48_9CHAR